MPWVRVKDGVQHRTLGGIASGGDVIEILEAEVVSFGDKFELPEDDESPVATKAAREYAEEHSISLSLSGIQGTGKGGRITLQDIKAALHGDS
jgi:pyruvate/2-oxoglutarate dehydrogenase complex dihydrolipoamide acyltransferase (E2) component